MFKDFCSFADDCVGLAVIVKQLIVYDELVEVFFK